MAETAEQATRDVDKAFDRILDSIKQLPSPPEVCLAVTRAVQDQATTLTDLQQLVESDIALSGKLIQMSNSAFFGVRERVTSVRRAITLLGFGTVKTLALGFFFNEEFGKLRLPGLPYPDLPRYALAASVVAEAVADRTSPELVGEAASVGLLHESGVIVMALAFGRQYRKMLARLGETDQPFWQLETDTFGVNHARAGQMLLKGWKLSDSLTGPVAAHHAPQPPAGDDPKALALWRVLRLTDPCAALLFGRASPELVAHALQVAHRQFGWTAAEVCAVLEAAEPVYKDRTFILGLASDEVPSAARVAAIVDILRGFDDQPSPQNNAHGGGRGSQDQHNGAFSTRRSIEDTLK